LGGPKFVKAVVLRDIKQKQRIWKEKLRQLKLVGASLNLLSKTELDYIHNATLEILENPGLLVACMHKKKERAPKI